MYSAMSLYYTYLASNIAEMFFLRFSVRSSAILTVDYVEKCDNVALLPIGWYEQFWSFMNCVVEDSVEHGEFIEGAEKLVWWTFDLPREEVEQAPINGVLLTLSDILQGWEEVGLN